MKQSLRKYTERVANLEAERLQSRPQPLKQKQRHWFTIPFERWRYPQSRAQAEEDYRRQHKLPGEVFVMAWPIYGEFLAAKGANYRDSVLRDKQPDYRRRLWAEMGLPESELQQLEAQWIREGLVKPDGSPLDHER